jgi:hypothetical protein
MDDIIRDEAMAKIAWEELEIESLESCELVERHVGLSRSALLNAYAAGRDRGYDEGFEAGGDHAKEMLAREAEDEAEVLAQELADKIGRRIKARFSKGGPTPADLGFAAARDEAAERERLLAPFTRDCHIAKGIEKAAEVAKEYAEELGSVGNNVGASAGFAIEDILRAKARQ